MSRRLRKLFDRLSKKDPSLTDLVISAPRGDSDDETERDDDDGATIDSYALLARHLPNNKFVESISVTEEGPCDDNGVPSFAAVLPTVPAIKHLSLLQVGLSGEDVESIARVLPELTNLQTLNLEGNGIDDDGFAPLCEALGRSTAPKLRVLGLGSNVLSDVGAKSLAQVVLTTAAATHLTSFSVGVCLGKAGMRSICRALDSHPQIETLDLSGNKRGAADLASTVASILPSLPSLRCLKLNSTGVGPRGTKTLLTTIAKNKVLLNELHLAGCRVGFFGAKAVQTIGLLPSLEVLNLGNNAITNDGVWQLTRVVGTLERLRILDLSSNQLGDDAAAEIARMLPSLQSLSSLDLSGNKEIGDSGAEVLADALQSMPTLSELTLTYNSIGNLGSASLGALLENENCHLVDIDLNGNKVGDEGAVALAQGIKSNTSLTHLDLRANVIGDEGVGEFLDTLDANTTLLKLDLRQNSISSSRMMVLDMLLKHRTPARSTDINLSDHPAESFPALPATPVSTGVSEEDVAFDSTILEQSRKILQEASTPSIPPAKIPSQYTKYCTEKYNIRNLLSYGSFGDLHEGFDVETGRRYGIRRLVLSDAGVLSDMRSRTIEDLAKLKLVNHGGTLLFLGYSIEKTPIGQDDYAFIYDIGTRTTLNEFIADVDKRRSMPWTIRVKFLKDIVGAVHYLHSGSRDDNLRPSFHGDIKSANIFVNNDFTAKLVDSGVSRLLATDRSLFRRGDVVFGTRGYRCPRYERGQKYTNHSDVFSLGIVMSEIIGGKLQGNVDERTGKEQDYYYQYILERKITVDPLGGTINNPAIGALCHIAMVCMNSEPLRRPTASVLLGMLERWYM
jgi:Ran GTPase-activating protein (RanGAP) involved in mRNA processing and transport